MFFLHPTLQVLLRARWQMLGGAIAGLLLGAIAVLIITPKYTVEMVVGPVSMGGPAGMGTPAARNAEVSRTNFSSDNDALTDYERYLQLLTSPSTAQILIREVPDILQTLFPGRWDKSKKQWRLPLAAWPAELIRRARGAPPWQAPTPEDVAARLQQLLQTRVIGATQMRELRLQYPDRGFGITLLYEMHQAADRVLREEAARRSAAISGYLERQLRSVQMQEHRAVLSELLAAQERIRILVAVDLPFAADIIEPPSAPLSPDVPEPWPILIFGAFAGAFFSALHITWPRLRLTKA